MPKKKKTIVHIGMGKTLCGVPDKKVKRCAWSDDATVKHYEKYALRDDERLCHKCKHIHKLNLAKVK